MTTTNPPPVPWHLQAAVYGIGLSSTTMFYLASVVVPLWVATIESSPFLIGVVLGARHFLPLFLSIHGGALMDRLGGRRVMVFFGIVGIITPLLFPMMPWIGAVLVLQMIAGLSDSMGWLGAQTLIGHHMRGSTVYTARLSFTCRFGPLFVPPAIGWVWDIYGSTWAFVGLSVWGLGFLICALMLPRHEQDPIAAKTPKETRVRVRDVMPRMVDYVDAFRMLGIPAIALIVMVSMLSHVGSSVQSSFYVVYLGEQGFTGTQIGSLLTAASFAALGGALSAHWMARRFKPFWFVMTTVLAGILSVAVTPAIGLFWLLVVASAVRGAANGATQPIIISTVLRAVGPEARGKAAGMRGTCNRISSIASPVIMGGLAELVGIETSFYLIGVIATVLMGALVVHVKRSAALTGANKIYSEDE
ncbi:MAG: MFS transporter [Alphaproteobacteria bacterium]|nr:MFS transporter [Alphaproteobacteria bacterium]